MIKLDIEIQWAFIKYHCNLSDVLKLKSPTYFRYRNFLLLMSGDKNVNPRRPSNLLSAETKYVSEAGARRCSVKTVFLEISQNSQEAPVPESLF